MTKDADGTRYVKLPQAVLATLLALLTGVTGDRAVDAVRGKNGNGLAEIKAEMPTVRSRLGSLEIDLREIRTREEEHFRELTQAIARLQSSIDRLAER